MSEKTGYGESSASSAAARRLGQRRQASLREEGEAVDDGCGLGQPVPLRRGPPGHVEMGHGAPVAGDEDPAIESEVDRGQRRTPGGARDQIAQEGVTFEKAPDVQWQQAEQGRAQRLQGVVVVLSRCPPRTSAHQSAGREA